MLFWIQGVMEKENDRKVCARKSELQLSFGDLRVMDMLEQLSSLGPFLD